MFSRTSLIPLLAGSAAVSLAVGGAVAIAATDPTPAPAPAPAVRHSQPAPAPAPKRAKPAPKRQHTKPAPRHAKAAAVTEDVALPAPPPGVKVKMPKLEPRVASAPGSTVDKRGVNLTGRPQMRLTMTEKQTRPYWDLYNACLHAHGVPLYPGRGLSPVQTDRDPAAERACQDQMPLMPIALDRDRNPHFARDLEHEIACINAHGVPVAADPAGGFWSYRDPANARERELSTLQAEPERNRIERACELQAFGADDR